MKKITFTQKKGALNDNVRTSVLVETTDLTTGEIFQTLGLAKVCGDDRFDDFIGERIAFNKGLLENYKKMNKTHIEHIKVLIGLLKEEEELIKNLSEKIKKTRADLIVYSLNKEIEETNDDDEEIEIYDDDDEDFEIDEEEIEIEDDED